MRPRIAIPVATTANVSYNQRAWPSYAAAVTQSGGEPVAMELTASEPELRALASGCDGVLLPGSPADVDPARYGAERDPASAAADGVREAVDYLLLEEAEKQGKPVLGICFGMQSLNVWRGGTLVQDLMPVPVNHGAGGSVAVAHAVQVAKGSVLASLLTEEEAPAVGGSIGTAGSPGSIGSPGSLGSIGSIGSNGFLRLPVNSSHHQSVAVPGDGLRVVARCMEDGVMEAVELDLELDRDLDLKEGGDSMFHVEHARPRELPKFPAKEPPAKRFVLGVQWHPERSFAISAASRALFARLVAEARCIAEARAEAAAADALPAAQGTGR